MTARVAFHLRGFVRKAGRTLVDVAAVILLKAARLIPPHLMISGSEAFLRLVGPLLPENRIGVANLAAAFPEKTRDEINTILRGVWANLGRVSAEFVYLDRLVAMRERSGSEDYVEVPPELVEQYSYLLNSKKPMLIFAGHLANWEAPAVLARIFDFDVAAVYRPLNLPRVREAVSRMRSRSMPGLIPSQRGSSFEIRQALVEGKAVGMLIDQYFAEGVDVEFFGRRTKANPTLAVFARYFECDVYGARAIRLPDGRLRMDFTGPVDLPRDSSGKIDVQGTAQKLTSVLEGWIKEHPEQWLWLHRRWR
jgi:KDO2-lipid IV(A) lauroyltransferase